MRNTLDREPAPILTLRQFNLKLYQVNRNLWLRAQRGAWTMAAAGMMGYAQQDQDDATRYRRLALSYRGRAYGKGVQ